jgi:hypothetical protein
METIVVNYAGHPPTWLHDTHCTPSGSSGMSKNFTVGATSGPQASGSDCWVQFQVGNGGSGQSTS